MLPQQILSNLKTLTPEQRSNLLASVIPTLSKSELEALETSWELFARQNQLPPEGDWFVWLYLAGRGSGKTRSGCEWVRHKAMTEPGCRIAIVACTTNDAINTLLFGESGLMNIGPEKERPRVLLNAKRLEWSNGSLGYWYSCEEPDRLRGPQHHYGLADELGAWTNLKDTWDNLVFGMRLGDKPQIAALTTGRPRPELRAIKNHPDTVVSTGSSHDNLINLAPQYARNIRQFEGTRIGLQEIYGEILEDDGLLFQRNWINRLPSAPKTSDIDYSVIAIDPATTANKDSDETGIIVVHKLNNGTSYVVKDASIKASPDVWARISVGLYHDFKCKYMVVETNQGGDMIENIIKGVDLGDNKTGKTIKYHGTHALKGKSVRAEPVAALYERGLIAHAPDLDKLEDQLEGFPLSKKSPDRVDALVYALSAIYLDLIPPARGMITKRLGWF